MTLYLDDKVNLWVRFNPFSIMNAVVKSVLKRDSLESRECKTQNHVDSQETFGLKPPP